MRSSSDQTVRASHDVIVIGGGPAGLATSQRLTEWGIDHVVLDRGRVAERWRTERWDSLRLLTPNWQTRLPGWGYTGGDPDGYMTMPEVVDYLDQYAASFNAPIIEDTEVVAVGPADRGFIVRTNRSTYLARSVVVAAGAGPAVPGWSHSLTPSVAQIHSSAYRRPENLPPGNALVIGASASGIQIAHELRTAGRGVVLSVGEHTRLPRTYRGRDVHWWLDVAGTLDATVDQVHDLERARRSPSLQLVGTPDHRTLDLNALSHERVELVGRARPSDRWSMSFEDDLRLTTARADRRMYRLLDLFDHVATAAALDDRLEPSDRPEPTCVPAAATTLDLDERGISTVLWATGFRFSYPWLDVPVFDDAGTIRHEGGVTPWPGLYTMGLPFMRRRKSTFLDGFGDDAEAIVSHLAGHLARAGIRRSGGRSRPD